MISPLTNEEFTKIAQPLIELGRQNPVITSLFRIIDDKWISANKSSIDSKTLTPETMAKAIGYQECCVELQEDLERLFSERAAQLAGAKKDE